jgi:acyl-CoA-binding protein
MESDKIQIKEVNMKLTENLTQLFKLKADKLKEGGLKLDNNTRLQFYGLFKVATVGKITDENKNAEGFFSSFENKYKKYLLII